MPTAKELKKWRNDYAGAADHFGVSERTIRNWLQASGLYEPRENYGPGKLAGKAEEIRSLRRDGNDVKEIASRYGVTPAAIYRLCHGITYGRKSTDTSIVSVTYNT